MKLSKNSGRKRPDLSKRIDFVTKHGDDRDRTGDLWLAKPPLSQLSYIPFKMGLNGVEPLTSRLSGARSNQLSYRPNYLLSETQKIKFYIKIVRRRKKTFEPIKLSLDLDVGTTVGRTGTPCSLERR